MKMPLDFNTDKPVFALMSKTVSLPLEETLAWFFGNGADVGDNTYDVLVNVCASDRTSGDNYDLCMGKIHKGVKVVKTSVEYDHIVADVTGWIEAHRDLMTEFCKEFNNDTYQMDVPEEEQYYEEDDPLYVGVLTWEGLVVGNYSDRAYKWLADRL